MPKFETMRDFKQYAFQTKLDSTKDEVFRFLRKTTSGGHRKDIWELLVICSKHENGEIRELVVEIIDKFLPTNKWEILIEYWLILPTPLLKKKILERVKKSSVEYNKEIKAALFLMCEDYDSLEKENLGVKEVEDFLNKRDIYLYGPLHEKLRTFKQLDFEQYVSSRTLLVKRNSADQEPEHNLNDVLERPLLGLIRAKDWREVWHTALNSSLYSLLLAVKELKGVGWIPNKFEEPLLYEFCVQYLMFKSKDIIYDLLELAIHLTKKDADQGQYEIFPDVILRDNPLFYPISDYHPCTSISQSDLIWTDPNNYLIIHKSKVQFQMFLNLISITISNCHGRDLLEIRWITSDEEILDNIQIMSEEEGYLTIETETESLKVEIGCLRAVFLTLPFLTKDSLYWIEKKLISRNLPTFNRKHEPTNYKLYLKVLKDIVTINLGFDYKLDEILDQNRQNELINFINQTNPLLEIVESDIKHPENPKLLSLGIDFGNYFTRVVIYDNSTKKPFNDEKSPFLKEMRVIGTKKKGWCFLIPSRIAFDSLEDIRIGNQVKPTEQRENPRSFFGMKHELRTGSKIRINVQGKNISIAESAEIFLQKILSIIEKIEHQITKIFLTHPVDSPPEFQSWLFDILSNWGQQSKITDIIQLDEATAAALFASNRIKRNKPTLFIDMGAGTTDVVLLKFQMHQDELHTKILGKKSNETAGNRIQEIMYKVIVKDFFKMSFQHESIKTNGIRLLLEFENVKYKLAGGETLSKTTYTYIKKKATIPALNSNNVDRWLEDNYFYEDLSDIIDNVLDQATVTKDQIHQIVLIGGGAKWSGVKKFLKDYFPESAFLDLTKDSFAVARGCMNFRANRIEKIPLNASFGVLQRDTAYFILKEFYPLLKEGEIIEPGYRYFEIKPLEYQSWISLRFYRHRFIKRSKIKNRLRFTSDGKLEIIPNLSDMDYYEQSYISEYITDIKEKSLYLVFNVSRDLLLSAILLDQTQVIKPWFRLTSLL